MFTKYGYTTLGIISIIVFIVISLSFFLNNNYFKAALIILAVFFLVFSLNFFRDPERTPPNRKDVVVAPADGKVLLIKDVQNNQVINGKARQVSIFMSPLNVHVNRIPIDGIVRNVRYIEGKFIAAFEDKADEENERSEFVIESSHGNVLFTQVAGFVARRIVYEMKEGEEVKMGNRFGMIKFGSRVDVVVPADWILKVSKDDIVTAGETILFEIPAK
jgi:phosphatidylserine decarboxylase